MSRFGVLLLLLFLYACSSKPTPKNEVEDSAPKFTATPKPTFHSNHKSDPTLAQKSLHAGIDSPEFQAEYHDPDWKLLSEENGVKTYQKKTQNSSIVTFRGETLIPAPIEKIATILGSDELRKQWVDALAESHVIQQINKTERIEYNHSNVPWPFHDRDFVYRVNAYLKRTPNSMLVTIKSVTDERMPPRDGIVRGEIEHAYYYLTSMEGVRATQVVVEMALDPKGVIPLWLMNAAQKNWPSKTLHGLRRMAEREDIPPSKDVQDYFAGKENQE